MPMLRIALVLLLALGFLHPGAGVAEEEHIVLRPYDLADLLRVNGDFPARGLGTSGRDTWELMMQASANAPRAANALDDFLGRFFEAGVAARLRTTCELRGDTLFLNATPAVHRHVEEVLDQARNRANMQIATTSQLFLMSPALRQTRYHYPGLAWRAVPGAPGVMWAELAPNVYKVLTETLAGDKEVEEDYSPSVTCFNGQLANAAFIHQRAYAKLVFTTAGQTLGADVVNYGETLTVRPTATSDGAFIHLLLDHRRCSLLEMRKVSLGDAADKAGRFAERPVVEEVGEHLDAAILDGHGVIIASELYLDTDAAGKSLARTGFLLVQSTIIAVDKPVPAAAAPPQAPAVGVPNPQDPATKPPGAKGF